MVPWSHLRQPSLGWVTTVLTAELTHFELVIHLSKLQQLALRFVSHFEFSCCSGCPRDYPPMRFFNCEAVPNSRNLLFSQLLLTVHDNSIWYRNQAGTRLSGVVFFLLVVWWGETYCAPNSLELESRLCQLGLDSTTVPVQGIIARPLGI